MSVTAVIVFRALPGKTDELVTFLRDNQPKLRAFEGFESIALSRDEDDPRCGVEIERWRSADDHRAMLDAVTAAGGFDPLDALTEGEPEVRYLGEIATLHAGHDGEPGRVTGVGGVFFKGRDHEGLRAWYREHLGIDVGEHGADFTWRHLDAPDHIGHTAWSIFAEDTTYFDPSESRFMINYRVDDLDAVLAKLRAAGVRVDEKIDDYDFGRFGWAMDPEGNRIELWEPRGE
jgi:quinol monooxygenase YgiN/catechol 2,3-dioxygenase-like lactoylglutathione lyase family enzyme